VAQELLETEGSYVKNLAILIRVRLLLFHLFLLIQTHPLTTQKFQNPMLNSSSSPKPLASEAETRTIFSSVEIIFSLNSMLLEGLNNKMRHWSSKQTIGDVFLYLVRFHLLNWFFVPPHKIHLQGDFLKSYTDYINNYDNSQLTVLKCKDNSPRFARFLEVRFTSLPSAFSLPQRFS